jgi:hypothetical protein
MCDLSAREESSKAEGKYQNMAKASRKGRLMAEG